MIQEIEQKRVECNRLMRNRNKRRISKFLKTPEMLEQEAQQAKWKSSKVGSEEFEVVKIPILSVSRCARSCAWSRRLTSS